MHLSTHSAMGGYPINEAGSCAGVERSEVILRSTAMSINTIQAIDQIATNPRIRNGRPFIIGTTVTVADVAVAKVFMMMEA